jgi:hypothetical protein
VARLELTCHEGKEGGGEPCACRAGSKAGGNGSFEVGGRPFGCHIADSDVAPGFDNR